MEYRLPTLEDREALQDYLRECRDNNEQNVLLHQELLEKDYPTWVGRIGRNSREGDGDWGRSLLLLCCDGDEAVGILCIRYELSDDLEAVYGNIGYSVRRRSRARTPCRKEEKRDRIAQRPYNHVEGVGLGVSEGPTANLLERTCE